MKYPQQITILRGSHEDEPISKNYGLYYECKAKLGEDPDNQNSIFNQICNLFNYLPLAATINDKILCVHSGIGDNIKSLNDIASIKRPCDIYNNVLVYELLWSTPSIYKETETKTPNTFISKLKNCYFNEEKVKEFCSQNKIDMFIRTKDCLSGGFEKIYNNRVLTVFSVPNYCGINQNSGGCAFIKKNMEVVMKILYPEDNGSCWSIPNSIMEEYPPSPKKDSKN